MCIRDRAYLLPTEIWRKPNGSCSLKKSNSASRKSNLKLKILENDWTDEDLANFKEMYDWMNAIVPVSDPTAFANFTGTEKTATGNYSDVTNDLAQYSDITIVVNTNKNIPNKFFRFHDAFPISLSGIELQSGSETDAVVATVEFRFTYYDIESTS